MANKPTKAEYEGFKKAIANPMTPQPIKDKLQSVIDKYASEYEGMDEGSNEPKPSKAPRKPRTTKTTSGTKRAGRKPSTTAKPTMSKADAYEKAKADLKAKTGKTEEECEKIINQYRELRAKAQTRKAKEEEASKENKKRLEKLEEKGDLIAGTNEKTADAVIETTTKDVAEKIVKEIEAIEDKAEKDAKAEVAKDKTLKTPQEKKDKVDEKVKEKVAEKTKPMIQRIVIDTSELLKSISSTLGKFDKDSQKEFLIKLRSDIDKLLAKFAFGGMTDGAVQVMNVQQSNLSASSVNPTLFAKGGGVHSGAKIRIDSIYVDVYEDSYEEGEGQNVNSYSRNELVGKILNPKDLIKFLNDELYTSDDPSDYSIMDGAIFTSQLVDVDGSKASQSEIERWKKGDFELFSESIRIAISVVYPTETTDEELSKLTGIGLYKKSGKVKMSKKYDKGGEVSRLKDFDLKEGSSFTLRNGDEIVVKKLFIENGDENWVGYSRNGKDFENSVKELRMFINRVNGFSYAKGGKVGKVNNSDLLKPNLSSEQKAVLKTIIPILNKKGLKLRYGTMVGQYPQSVIYDLNYQDSILSIPSEGFDGEYAPTWNDDKFYDAYSFENLLDREDYANGGGVDDISYEAILDVLKDKLDDAVQDVPNHFENAYNAEGQEVEHESRDGFIPFTNGGYEVRWFDYLSYFWSSGYSLPTFALDKEKDRQIDYQMEMAKERFMNEYPEIVEELGEDNIDYNSLDEAGYSDEAEELSMYESEFEDDTIMCEIGAYYYAPNNDRGIDGKHTLRLFGLVNLESPYHRSGNLEDRYDIDITFDSIEELEEKVEQGLNEITNWFDGSDYNGSTEELRIVRMAKGGLTEHGLKVGDKIEKKLDSEGSVIRVKNKKENAFVALDSGFRMPIYEFSSMAKGGGVRSNSNQVREKVRQHILENVYDYDENEFENFNDASQHLTSEFKRVADYPNNISRFPNNQKRFRDYLQGIPFNFYFYDDDIEDFLNGLGINPQNKKYSSDQMWDLYSYLIWKEVEPTYNAKKMAKGGGIATNLSITETNRIANATAKALGSDFKVTKDSVDVASFDLDFKGEPYDGGSYLVMENGDVVNYGLPERPIYYNYKTKKKFAHGGEVGSGKRVAESVELSKRDINDFVDYVYEYYEEEGFSKSQVRSAVNKYVQALGTQFFWGGGDSFDREITAQFLYNPNQKNLQNPLMKKGGNVKTTSRSKRKPRQPKMTRIQFEEETYEYGKGGEISIYNLKKGDKIKTRKGEVETIERKIESGYFTKESEYSHPFESIEFIERPKSSKGGDIASMMRNRRGK
jgi:hypothetical protein